MVTFPSLDSCFKRVLDILFSGLLLLALSPFLLLVAIVIKFESKGPVLYASERIGKKGRVFRCYKFRTMVRDAEKRRGDFMHMNERDGVLFKITTTLASPAPAASCANTLSMSCPSSSMSSAAT